jgi:hypothetical protein
MKRQVFRSSVSHLMMMMMISLAFCIVYNTHVHCCVLHQRSAALVVCIKAHKHELTANSTIPNPRRKEDASNKVRDARMKRGFHTAAQIVVAKPHSE